MKKFFIATFVLGIITIIINYIYNVVPVRKHINSMFAGLNFSPEKLKRKKYAKLVRY